MDLRQAVRNLQKHLFTVFWIRARYVIKAHIAYRI